MRQTIAGLLDAKASPAATCLVRLRQGDEEGSVVLIPGIDGGIEGLSMLAAKLPGCKTVFALQTPLHGGIGSMPPTLTELCALYADQWRQASVSGPVALVGHSFGGMVAVELARQLEQRDFDVAGVILLDSTAPSLPAEARAGGAIDTSPRALLMTVAEVLGLQELRGPLQTLELDDAFAAVAHAMQSAHLGIEDPRAWLQLRVDNAMASGRMAAMWRPGPPKSPVYLVWAQDELQRQLPKDLGWSRWLTVVSACSVPGSHHGMLSGCFADASARAVARILELL